MYWSIFIDAILKQYPFMLQMLSLLIHRLQACVFKLMIIIGTIQEKYKFCVKWFYFIYCTLQQIMHLTKYIQLQLHSIHSHGLVKSSPAGLLWPLRKHVRAYMLLQIEYIIYRHNIITCIDKIGHTVKINLK